MTIAEIQRALVALGFSVAVDGRFGEESRAAIRFFQQCYGLHADGIPGPQTQAALKQALAAPKPGRPEPDKSAMAAPAPVPQRLGTAAAAPPPNVASLQLLDTARPVAEIIWHCTATPEGKDFTVADVRAWHKARGWSDIGYHYVVYRDGRIMLGRPVGQIGAHCEGHNTGTIGCSYIGGLSADGKTAKDTRTSAQRASMLWLTQQLSAKHRGIKRVSGHNQYANKACPSFDVRKDDLGRLI
ncbi:N-acetylmuramoyl-L-alanine amidase [Bosea sp. 62]|uniref:peptidoglycan recognition protein family protein n=1 Tax=unclassified Bosea (in: a-proteobacteria) TaxID=2653178 RepID=UPI0012588E35|nr:MULTISPECIES: peptidoglycan-binding protein [unclassified Bosea (in: a-proteobacteria)]CAD5254481.1 N-acetylmuramoyl-L-alanine amidase [Bosea sp. 7B]CAD5276524.1 N-acetylmuramoyl-L-alanine amidase [Bosea sp. 21B]CAD5277689.1 N-acetylmuramoyl-L-alanine amidase [Bosea sp. 46]VVT59869.1 putative peptidoglycan binding protein [Bosea sp. EC-HK365B]VXB46776.1 N-acetylmuramoyl-L-alanine amidase [Bosea sp. 62]